MSLSPDEIIAEMTERPASELSPDDAAAYRRRLGELHRTRYGDPSALMTQSLLCIDDLYGALRPGINDCDPRVFPLAIRLIELRLKIAGSWSPDGGGGPSPSEVRARAMSVLEALENE